MITCANCKQKKMKLETISLQLGENKAKVLRTVGLCSCGFQITVNENRWKNLPKN